MKKRFLTLLTSSALVGALGSIATPTAAHAAEGKCGYSGSHPTLSSSVGYSAAAKHAQCLLINYHWSYYSTGITQDGFYGPKTIAAVGEFQYKCGGLTVDGIVGPNTWRALHPDTSWCNS